MSADIAIDPHRRCRKAVVSANIGETTNNQTISNSSFFMRFSSLLAAKGILRPVRAEGNPGEGFAPRFPVVPAAGLARGSFVTPKPSRGIHGIRWCHESCRRISGINKRLRPAASIHGITPTHPLFQLHWREMLHECTRMTTNRFTRVDCSDAGQGPSTHTSTSDR